jgi:hypothetical protein
MTSDDSAPKQGEYHERLTDPLARPDEPGAYIGSQPEREAETIPGGIQTGDERVAAHDTQAGPLHDDSGDPSDRREAGQSR